MYKKAFLSLWINLLPRVSAYVFVAVIPINCDWVAFLSACSLLLFILFTQWPTTNWRHQSRDVIRNSRWRRLFSKWRKIKNFRAFVCQPEMWHKILVAIFVIYSSKNKAMSKLVGVPFNSVGTRRGACEFRIPLSYMILQIFIILQ